MQLSILGGAEQSAPPRCANTGCSRPIATDRTKCQGCLDACKRRVARYRRRHPDRLKPEPKLVAAMRARNKRAARKAAGLCIQCGEPAATSRCSACHLQHNQYHAERRRERKQKAIEILGGCCADCGITSEFPEVYDFHHPNPEIKDSGVAELLDAANWEAALAEVLKCILLCANCHRIRHAKCGNTRAFKGE